MESAYLRRGETGYANTWCGCAQSLSLHFRYLAMPCLFVRVVSSNPFSRYSRCAGERMASVWWGPMASAVGLCVSTPTRRRLLLSPTRYDFANLNACTLRDSTQHTRPITDRRLRTVCGRTAARRGASRTCVTRSPSPTSPTPGAMPSLPMHRSSSAISTASLCDLYQIWQSDRRYCGLYPALTQTKFTLKDTSYRGRRR